MKIVDFRNNEYGHNGHNGYYKQYDYNPTIWLCASCGARYDANPSPKTDLTRIHNGIKLVTGHIQQEATTKAYKIRHLNTKNGPVTVGIRTARCL